MTNEELQKIFEKTCDNLLSQMIGAFDTAVDKFVHAIGEHRKERDGEDENDNCEEYRFVPFVGLFEPQNISFSDKMKRMASMMHNEEDSDDDVQGLFEELMAEIDKLKIKLMRFNRWRH